MTKDVKDNAIVLTEIAGNDPKDATSTNSKIPDYTENLDSEIKGMKIGLPKEYFGEGLDSVVKKEILGAVENYKKLYFYYFSLI